MVIDISQEIFSCRTYPGDPAPVRDRLLKMEDGALYNLSAFSMCVHNGTHLDAPAHFFKDGKTIDAFAPEVFTGDCYVARHTGDVLAEDAQRILAEATACGAARRILIAGDAVVTEEAARVFADAKLLLIGNESQSVGPENAPMAVHKILLGAEVILLEGVILTDVPAGKYLLCAMPLLLADCEGAPCRAVLIQQ
jgi:arylformamidase